ncbi:MAG TPA: helix-turn-helix domain-containing protein [Acidimicrobiales bacterium]|nr:helix-turn-helix domain-containing protein [Acidimicrobiales bacterium]
MLTPRYTLWRIPVQAKLLPRAERRASILRGAAAAFARSGFAHTSMEDVAAACGVTKLIVYRHFSTKEELYRAILQGVFDRLGEELQAGLAAQRPNRGLGARTQLTVAREDPDGYTLLWRHAAREPMFAAYAASTRAISIDVVRQLLRLDSGDTLMDRWKAETLFAFLVDATLAWLDGGDPARDDDYLIRTTTGFWALLEAWATHPA